MVKRCAPYLFIVVFLLPILYPLYSNSLLGSADNLAHLFRIVNLNYALEQGYLWPRWAALEGHGFGAPIFNFNYILPYYIVVGLRHLIGSLLHASQIYMMLVLLGSAFTLYVFSLEFSSIPASVIAAIAYAYFPYHLLTIFLYGGYGEALAYVLMPLTFFFLYRSKHHQSKLYWFAAIGSFSLLILAHNLSALLTLVLVITFLPILLYQTKRKTFVSVQTFGVVVWSVALTTWFWLPALVEQRFTNLNILFEKETALRGYFFQLIAPVFENSWRLLSLEAPSYYSYAIGIPSIVITVLTLYFFYIHIRQHVKLYNLHKNDNFKTTTSVAYPIGLYFLCWTIVSFALTRQFSEPLWKLLPARMNFLSYPYRFFFITAFGISGLTGFVIDRIWKNTGKRSALIISVIITLGFVWQGVMYAHPSIDTFAFPETYFQTIQTVRSAPRTYKNMGYIEFIPTTADSDFINGLDMLVEPKSRIEVISGQATVSVHSLKAQDLYIDVNALTESMLQVNILYFPGWIGIMNGKRVIPTIDKVGRMVFTLPTGQYQLHIAFQNTPIRSIATVISIISFCGLLLFWLRQHYA